MDVDLAGSFADLEKQVKSLFGLHSDAITLAYREPKRGGSKAAVVGLADDADYLFFVKAIRAAPKNANFVVVVQVRARCMWPRQIRVVHWITRITLSLDLACMCMHGTLRRSKRASRSPWRRPRR